MGEDMERVASQTAAAQRGRVLQVPGEQDGLISIDGHQHAFGLRQHWRSDAPPALGAWVDAWFDASGNLREVRLSSNTAMAGERASELAQAALAQAGEHALPLARQALSRWRETPGVTALCALALTLLAWTSLDLFSVRGLAGQSMGLSLWQILQVSNSAGDALAALQYGPGYRPSAGLYGLLALTSLALPLAMPWVRHRLAALLLCAPLLFMAVLLLRGWQTVHASVANANAAAGALGSAQAAQMVEQMQRELMDQFWRALSLGLGFYLAFGAALLLASLGLLQLQAGRRA